MQKGEFGPLPHIIRKYQFNMNHRPKCKSLKKFLEENRRKSHDFGLGKDFLDTTPRYNS